MPEDFDTFLTGLAALNQAVTDTEADWRTTALERVQLIKEIKSRALRAMARVKSDRKWAVKLDAVKQTYDNLRGYRTPSIKNPPTEEGIHFGNSCLFCRIHPLEPALQSPFPFSLRDWQVTPFKNRAVYASNKVKIRLVDVIQAIAEQTWF